MERLEDAHPTGKDRLCLGTDDGFILVKVLLQLYSFTAGLLFVFGELDDLTLIVEHHDVYSLVNRQDCLN